MMWFGIGKNEVPAELQIQMSFSIPKMSVAWPVCAETEPLKQFVLAVQFEFSVLTTRLDPESLTAYGAG
jgi:hypothetical protein